MKPLLNATFFTLITGSSIALCSGPDLNIFIEEHDSPSSTPTSLPSTPLSDNEKFINHDPFPSPCRSPSLNPPFLEDTKYAFHTTEQDQCSIEDYVEDYDDSEQQNVAEIILYPARQRRSASATVVDIVNALKYLELKNNAQVSMNEQDTSKLSKTQEINNDDSVNAHSFVSRKRMRASSNTSLPDNNRLSDLSSSMSVKNTENTQLPTSNLSASTITLFKKSHKSRQSSLSTLAPIQEQEIVEELSSISTDHFLPSTSNDGTSPSASLLFSTKGMAKDYNIKQEYFTTPLIANFEQDPYKEQASKIITPISTNLLTIEGWKILEVYFDQYLIKKVHLNYYDGGENFPFTYTSDVILIGMQGLYERLPAPTKHNQESFKRFYICFLADIIRLYNEIKPATEFTSTDDHERSIKKIGLEQARVAAKRYNIHKELLKKTDSSLGYPELLEILAHVSDSSLCENCLKVDKEPDACFMPLKTGNTSL